MSTLHFLAAQHLSIPSLDIFRAAQVEAVSYKESEVTPPLLLDALLADPGRSVAALVRASGTNPQDLRDFLSQFLGISAYNRGNAPTPAEPAFAAALEPIIRLAVDESLRVFLLAKMVEPQHLLLGLLRFDDPLTTPLLRMARMTLEGTREAIKRQG